MISALEAVGEYFSPFLPFISGQNAANAIVVGLSMIGIGLLTICITFLMRRRRGKERVS